MLCAWKSWGSADPIEVLQEEVEANVVVSELGGHGAHSEDARLAAQERDVTGAFSQSPIRMDSVETRSCRRPVPIPTFTSR